MRLGRTLGLLTLFAGTTAWFATRAVLRRNEELRRLETRERLRWETDGGATATGPQPPGAETAGDRAEDLETGTPQHASDSQMVIGR